uniref:Uncharacterized protein n=1 Tax=Candidatus Kentrum sp. LFY TaxID=2126342 RepID=A0A450UPY9_9GAMM|nr:MAG: hypothetical protein BECKLFY1418A_GA0070994_10428 [Candidatus Kentron sp. LFY]
MIFRLRDRVVYRSELDSDEKILIRLAVRIYVPIPDKESFPPWVKVTRGSHVIPSGARGLLPSILLAMLSWPRLCFCLTTPENERETKTRIIAARSNPFISRSASQISHPVTERQFCCTDAGSCFVASRQSFSSAITTISHVEDPSPRRRKILSPPEMRFFPL